MEIKIRYTFKRKSDGHIVQEVWPIEVLEKFSNQPFIFQTKDGVKLLTPEWEIIGRDLWVGYEDYYGGDIIRIPNYETTWKHKEPDFDWRVFEIRMNQYTWALTNNAIYMPFKTYDGFGIPYEFEKIGDIYTTPELIEK